MHSVYETYCTMFSLLVENSSDAILAREHEPDNLAIVDMTLYSAGIILVSLTWHLCGVKILRRFTLAYIQTRRDILISC